MQEPELKNKLMNKAGRLLSRRLYSCGEMRLKLAPFADEEGIEEALKRLQELNLLNDSDYAYNLALYQMRQQGWGPNKVLHNLLRRKVEPDVAQAAIERVRQNEGFESLLAGYLEKALRKGSVPKHRKDLQKLINRLRRRGFQDDTIYTILRQKFPASLWRNYNVGE